MVIKTIKYVGSALLIVCSLYAGNTVQHYFGLGIPGSIIGMLLLFTLMATGIVSPEWVKPTAALFIRYMIILFIPISVGLMQHLELLSANAVQILASTIGGTTLVIILVALMLERILAGKK
ncbi:CidA/LrgA family protein [Vibrio sp. JC009]|uniref:CidA/LrgA family protein n=1 Tax=Vibrio sp. JC009 TaxID=2912314 RepID=UPI0023AEDFBB|nr:CidA/LrgA family protein [Vibrio sp. JC009]WED23105.1 CidA/LrgA family protein [Vibrio sp. JC009]